MFLGRETLEEHSQLPKKAKKMQRWGGCKLFVCMAPLFAGVNGCWIENELGSTFPSILNGTGLQLPSILKGTGLHYSQHLAGLEQGSTVFSILLD